MKIYGCIAWFIITLFVVYAFSLNTAASVFSDTIKTSLHINNIEAAIAVGAFIIGFAFMQIPAGYYLDKYNTKQVVSVGVLVLAVGNLLISFSHNLYLFTLSNLIQGIGGSFAFIAAGVIIAQWFSPKLFPILFGLTQTISCILTGIIHYLFVQALQSTSWNMLYQDLSIFGFILFILTMIFVKSPRDYKPSTGLSLKKSLGTVLRNSQILLCAITAATSFGILLAYGGFWYANIQVYYHVNTIDAFIISGLIFSGIGIGTPLFGWLSNRVKSRTLMIHFSLVLGNMTLLLGIYLPHFNIDTLMIIKSISFFIGFFLSGSMLLYTIVSESSSEETRGVALSITNTGVFLFNSLMMFVPYLFITSISTTFFTYLWVLPFSVMFSILLLYFIKDSYLSTLGDNHEI